MPHGILFRGGSEGAICERRITEDQLEAVIGLPSNLFYSTTIPACLLIFQATKPPERKSTVLFVDGSRKFVKGRNQNTLGSDDVEAIVGAYRIGEGDETVPARAVEHAEIKENGFDLNISRYLKTASADSVDVPTALEALREAHTIARRRSEAR